MTTGPAAGAPTSAEARLRARIAATDEVLRAIAAQPADPRPVFALIARHVRMLAGATTASLLEYDGTLLHRRADEGWPDAVRAELEAGFPRPPGPDFVPGRVVLADAVVRIADIATEPGVFAPARRLGSRSYLGIPLRHEGRIAGVLTMAHGEVGAFDAEAVELAHSFAEQAVIAMQNARLIAEQRARTAELQEALGYQTATSEVLQLISRATFDLRPVLQTLAETMARLCDAEMGFILRQEGEEFRAAASVGFTEAFHAYMAEHPLRAGRGSVTGRVALERRTIQVEDVAADPEYTLAASTALAGQRTALGVPLLRDGALLGVIVLARKRVEPFTPRQVALVSTFADQAVIAIENTRLLEALRARNDAYGEQVVHQSATIDVLKAMSASPADPQPVFERIAQRAREICEGDSAVIFQFDGRQVHFRHIALGPREEATHMLDDLRRAYPMAPSRRTMSGRAIIERRMLHMRDVAADAGILPAVQALGYRSQLAMPLLRGAEEPVGAIILNARKPGGFSDRQVELMRTFAEQAVIAIDSAETYRALQERTAELAARNDAFSEQIAHQAATIDVLKVMSASTGDTQPVFDTILRRAMALCGCAYGNLHEYDGTLLHLRAHAGWSEAAVRNYAAAFPRPPDRSFTSGRTILEGRAIHFANLDEEPDLAQQVRDMGVKSVLAVPLLREGRPIGAIALGRIEPGGFSAAQVALLQTFAEQAVIAVASAETFGALQQRTEELARSVSELSALEEVGRAVNASLELDTVLATIIERSVRLSQADEGTIYEFDEAAGVFVPKAAQGMAEARVAALRARRVRLGETHLGRAAAEARVVQVADAGSDPTLSADARGILAGIHAVLAVPLLREGRVLGGLVVRRRRPGAFEPGAVSLLQTFAAQCVLAIENARLFEEARRARAAAEAALADLRRTQDRLVQTEKLASLGQLTAGIAHEIKNPLNFVNNFSDLSAELVEELAAAVAPGRLAMEAGLREEIEELTATLRANLGKIAQHGRRADSIVRNMLLHSRAGEGEARPADLNALAAEALNLAYHGARAAQPDFAVALEQALDPAVGTVEVFPQEITRVLLNLVGNGFYAARRRAAEEPGHAPALRLATRDLGAEVEIRVRDNGAGIPEALRERIFQPFFTTKPAGEGTGLGLSLSHDIVVKQHGGRLEVESRPGAFTEFVVTLPRRMARGGGP